MRNRKSTVEDVKRDLAILDMADKYTLQHFATWANQMLIREDATALRDYLGTCPQEELEHLLVMGIRCNLHHPTVLLSVETAWLARIDAGELSASAALTAGEQHGRRTFQGEIYTILRNSARSKMFHLSPAKGLSSLKLNPAQLQRFLVGHTILANVLITLTYDRDLEQASACRAAAEESPTESETESETESDSATESETESESAPAPTRLPLQTIPNRQFVTPGCPIPDPRLIALRDIRRAEKALLSSLKNENQEFISASSARHRAQPEH
ncbi:hypothetical protein MKEN_00951200 [Mycena kentingensis (nom. inval.)]|nr:hypothetical protein MKEN_00951200 [Mycena kentingensis (nom. inval.)]